MTKSLLSLYTGQPKAPGSAMIHKVFSLIPSYTKAGGYIPIAVKDQRAQLKDYLSVESPAQDLFADQRAQLEDYLSVKSSAQELFATIIMLMQILDDAI